MSQDLWTAFAGLTYIRGMVNNLLSYTDAAQHCFGLGLSVTESTIRNWVSRGISGRKLQSHQMGNRTYIDRDVLEEFVAGGIV